tara:strand:- start:159 stop:815 length:657 start_codon:yes stop_codon:yes gene_type:complete
MKITCEDNMYLMARYKDNYFDLAIVDPPYGGAGDTELENGNRFGGRFDKYKTNRTGGTWASKYKKEIIDWDIAPNDEYFKELFRVSKNQIIWGGNYFGLPPNRHFLIWRKLTISEKFTMAMCEYAWSSFNLNAKWIEIAPQDSNRFHPTQKPVKLYQWILENYAEKGDKILDTHLGSGSIAIACDKLGYDLTACEINKEYFDAAIERLKEHRKQLKLF